MVVTQAPWTTDPEPRGGIAGRDALKDANIAPKPSKRTRAADLWCSRQKWVPKSVSGNDSCRHCGTPWRANGSLSFTNPRSILTTGKPLALPALMLAQ